jgi:hypothetical protein
MNPLSISQITQSHLNRTQWTQLKLAFVYGVRQAVVSRYLRGCHLEVRSGVYIAMTHLTQALDMGISAQDYLRQVEKAKGMRFADYEAQFSAYKKISRDRAKFSKANALHAAN